MSPSTEKLPTLTKEQENFVWHYICDHMNYEDRNPEEVINEDYNGNRSLYLRVMAGHLGIYFCKHCGKPTEKCPDLACLDEYQL